MKISIIAGIIAYSSTAFASALPDPELEERQLGTTYVSVNTLFRASVAVHAGYLLIRPVDLRYESTWKMVIAKSTILRQSILRLQQLLAATNSVE